MFAFARPVKTIVTTVLTAVVTAILVYAIVYVASNASTRQQSTQDTIVVSQGDRVFAGSGDPDDDSVAGCTVGYVDHADHTGSLSGHCVKGKRALYSKDMRPIGHVARVDEHDTAVVTFDAGVELGANVYSGDARINITKTGTNDRVCAYGATTDTLRCGIVTHVDENGRVAMQLNEPGEQGDSGGPIWSDGGYVGTYSGEYISNSDGSVLESYGHVPEEQW